MHHEIHLPFPPSNNQYYRKVNNRIIISKRGREYRKAVIECLRKYNLAGLNINVPLMVFLELRQSDKRKRDFDNYSKGLLDAFTKARFWVDDSIVTQGSVRIVRHETDHKAIMYVAPDTEYSFTKNF